MPKFTTSKDGHQRMTIRVEHRVSKEDIVILALYRHGLCTRNDYDEDTTIRAIAKAKALTKTDLWRMARETLYFDGPETPHYSVSDQNSFEVVEELVAHLTAKL